MDVPLLIRSIGQAHLVGLILVVSAANLHQAPATDNADKPANQGVPAWSATVFLRHAASCGAFSPDGRTFASGGLEDGKIVLWQVAEGKRLHEFNQRPGSVESLAFSRDGKFLESRTRHTEREKCTTIIRLWDVGTVKEVFKLVEPEVKLDQPDDWVVAFSPDRKMLAISRSQKTVQLTEIGSGQEIRKLAGHENRVRFLAFSPDGKTLASQDGDHIVHLWEVATGKELRRRHWEGQEIVNVAFAVGGKLLVTTHARDGCGRLTARVWDVAAPKLVLEAPLALSGTFSPNGKFVTAWTGLGPCLGGALILWAVNTSKEEPLVTGQIDTAGSPVFSSDGKIVAAVWGPPPQPDAMDAMVELWEVPTGKRLVKIGLPGGVNSAAFSPDGRLLALAGAKQCALQKLAPLRGLGGSVSVLSLSLDGRLLATGNVDGAIDLWDVATGKQLRRLPGRGKAIQAITFSPDGGKLASASADGTVRLWQVGTGGLHHSLNGDGGDIRALGFSPDGKTLMVDALAGSRRWDVLTGKAIDP